MTADPRFGIVSTGRWVAWRCRHGRWEAACSADTRAEAARRYAEVYGKGATPPVVLRTGERPEGVP